MVHRLGFLALLTVIATSVLAGILSLRQKSPTYDEYSYYGLGKEIITSGRWERPGTTFHPPLSYYLHSLPLFARDDYRPYDNLAWSRTVLLLASLVPAVAVSFLWAHGLYGPGAAVAAAVLVGLDPNMLAHARLITPDASLACWWTVSLWLWWSYLRKGSRWWLIGASLALGLALLTKYTSLLLIGSWIAASLVLGRACLRRAARGWIVGFAGALGILIAGYGFKRIPARVADINPESRLFSGLAKHSWVRSVPLPVPAPYLQGLDLQNVVAENGWPGFLMGAHSRRGWWYYFLVAAAVKSPLALFGLLALRAFGRHRRDDLFVVLPGIVLLGYMSFVGKVNIGLRYVLPLFPLLSVYASGSAASPVTWRKVATVFFVIWYAAASFHTFPHYLAYFNEIIGGPRNGYRYLVDSNLDWGQDDDRAIAFAQASAEPVYVNPGCTAVSGLVLVSATRFQGLPGMDAFDERCYDWLRGRQPIGHVGYSYLLFRVPGPSAGDAAP